MGDMQTSALLSAIMARAEMLCKENTCSGLTRDYILVAALSVLGERGVNGEEEEYEETLRLLEHFSREQKSLTAIIRVWQGRSIPFTETMLLNMKRDKAINAAKAANRQQLTADVFLREILSEETEAMKSLHKAQPQAKPPLSIPGLEQLLGRKPGRQEEDQPTERPAEDADKRPAEDNETVQQILEKAKQMQTHLQACVFGQQQAVSTFVSGYFQSELQAMIEENRKRPRITFLFAGPPGVGKTYLAEMAAKELNREFLPLDMSAFNGPDALDELCGTDEKFRGTTEGKLTGFVRKNPTSVVLLDEIEKASMQVLHLFLQVLDQGRLMDNKTNKEVSFKDCILIFTTNAGRKLYENDQNGNLSTLPRDVVLDALGTEINPTTREPFFPAALCSRFASGNVVMFNRLDAYPLRRIVETRMNRHIGDLKKKTGIALEMDDLIPTALLLAEGAGADARTVNGRVDAFFGGELYELYRLFTAQSPSPKADAIRTIHLSVLLEGEPEEVKRLFIPAERIHALAYADPSFALDAADERMPVIHPVHSIEEAMEVINEEKIQLVFCDLYLGAEEEDKRFLNREDIPSPARDFAYEMLKRFPDIPLVVTESEEHFFTEEEKVSYLRRGVKDFLSLAPEGLTERIRQLTDSIFRHNCMIDLARANRLVRYETAQRTNEEGTEADIILFDMKLEKAIKAGDAKSVLSMLSTPDERFEDVIGAEDAKKELQFFISYMKSPQKFRKKGAGVPKGLLLYGPPGTGKTMLAKAFASESNATFIAAEGNQFHKKYIGEGPELVHQLFATARRYAPAVLFIDEIDTIAKARSGRDTDAGEESEAVLTALLSEMDGFSEHAGQPVFVMGATNYGVEENDRMHLDAAVLRRFDRRILIDLPTLDNRKEYLKRETDKKEIFRVTQQGIDSLADRSTGMSLANLASVLDLAVRSVIQKQQDFVDDETLDEAFETFNGGQSKKWNAETTLRTARHEAGHAVLSWLAGDQPSYITIVSRKDYGGYMRHANQEDRMGYTRKELLDRIRTALGGRAAEIVYYGKDDGMSTGASADLRSATEIATLMLCRYGMDDDFGLAVIDPDNSAMNAQVQQDVNKLLRDQMAEAIRLLNEHRAKLDELVDQLLKRSSLREHEIKAILTGEAQ